MYDTGIFAKSTGASLGVVAVVGTLFLSTGVAFAVPISGIGGFRIQADRIAGDDFILYPGSGDAENHSNYPQGVAELREVEIEELRLGKRFNLDQYGMRGNARLVITAGSDGANVTTGQLLLKTPALSAETVVFNGMTVSERNVPDSRHGFSRIITLRTHDEPTRNGTNADLPGGTRQIELTGGSNPGLQMRYADIRATYLATNRITLPNLGLEVQYDPDEDRIYEYG
ncbi:hypothetical protein ACFR9U_08855 [Halorientalis brevis]|uniref:DUF1102 domain-containing protein n=1 Tax=Halorientalis brevis TaxID=1126241 RepID=A0ABD6CCC7_9EURY|nr:hypothetical protein [Halorientalis brevis]